MAGEGMYIDHVIYGVVDMDETAERLRRDHGLGSIPGGRHLGGTTNRLVPLEPPMYLELLGIGDTSLADAAWLSETLHGQDQVLWWVIGVDDIEESARRRGLAIQSGTMDLEGGGQARFRTAGMERYPMPFFVSYAEQGDDRLRTCQARYEAARHECVPGGFSFVEVGGGPALLDGWLGEHDMPVRFEPGPIGISAVGIETDRGEVVLR